ncbi:MAG TPA: hypothetical protein VM802_23755 [Chitinophaga sp.]|uniref:hypothetical protein n=1 Tax=Chitinophaga sp. TaxID=1869181 RepID=UPI002B5BFE6D|nr:hypothetical protein [Chitinophaga sp.]HVI47904.1 hypothetical protein [Chitinophaga sp.]
MKKKLIALFSLFLFSCSSTQLVTSWKAPDATVRKFNKILVAGLMGAKDRELRENVEAAMVQNLKAKGINAISAYTTYGPKAFEGLTDKEAAKKISADGFDGAFTIALLDRSKERNYTPGSVYYTPYATYYSRYWHHYFTLYDRIYNPGYYTTSTNYILEANFFNLGNDELEYSAQTKSFDPSSTKSLAGDFTKTLIDDMIKKGVIGN